MTDLLELKGEETVLEVGTGSGYQAAVLGKMARRVHTVERYAGLARQAEAVLRRIGLADVMVHIGDGSLGWPQAAPYDGILVTAAAPSVPRALLEQLADGGRLVIPVGGRGAGSAALAARGRALRAGIDFPGGVCAAARGIGLGGG